MAGETRRQIIAATEALIQSKGLARVTTKEIARATGMSEGALYRHFDHKDDVFLAVIGKQLPGLAGVIDQFVVGTNTVAENLIGICLAVISYYEQLIPLSAASFADIELLRRHRELVNLLGGPERLHERIAEYIAAEQQLGRIDPEPPALTIVVLLLGPLFQYAFLHQLLDDTPFDLDDRQFVENNVRVLMQGIVHSAT